MSFVRPVYVPKDDGMIYGPYYELVENERDEERPGAVKQRYIKYLGKYPGGVPLGTKLTTIDQLTLTYRSSIGMVQIWADPDVGEEDLDRLRKVLNDLTPGQKAHIRMVELIGRPADPGDDAWGVYFPDTRTIRIYGVVGAERGGNFTWNLESTIVHEAGHLTYDRLQRGAVKEIVRSPLRNLALWQAARDLDRAIKREARANAELRTALLGRTSGRVSDKQVQKAIRAQAQAVARREAGEEAFNGAVASADLDRTRTPQAAAYAKWQAAVREEGPITTYVQERSGEAALMSDENFAEASAIFTGYDERPLVPQAAPRPPRRMSPEEVRSLFPRTLAAWDEIRRLEGY